MGKRTESYLSLRLTKDDAELIDILNNLPKNGKSKIVKEMLLFAHKQMHADTLENEKLHLLENQLIFLQERQEKYHQDLMNKLNGVMVSNNPINISELESEEIVAEDVEDEALEATAELMLSMFGGNMDE